MNSSKLLGSATILLVNDVVASANFYRDRIGFAYNRFWGKPPAFCILHKGQNSIMLSRIDPEQSTRPNQTISKGMWDIYFWVDDVMKCFNEMKNNGAILNEQPTEQSHGCIEFTVTDLDGFLIAFGQDM